MRILNSIRAAIVGPMHRSRMNREMDEELRSHVEHRADDSAKDGAGQAKRRC